MAAAAGAASEAPAPGSGDAAPALPQEEQPADQAAKDFADARAAVAAAQAEKAADREAAKAARAERAARPPGAVTFPVGDWFLGAGDGGAGRNDEERPQDPRLRPGAADRAAVARAVEEGSAPAPKRLLGPGVGYGGELQLLEQSRSPGLLFSDVTDPGRFACEWGPRSGGRETAFTHPQLEFSRPHHRVRVHMEDMAAGPGRHVVWDGVYDMGGTGVLKAAAPPLGGLRPEMEKLCPPLHGPPHWYELTVSREPGPGMRRRALEDFVGSQVVESFRPDHDPLLLAGGADPHAVAGAKGCAVQ